MSMPTCEDGCYTSSEVPRDKKLMSEGLDIEGEGAENGLEFTIVRPFNWIGPRMDFIPGVDGPQDSVPRVLACFSNVNSFPPLLINLFLIE